MHNIQIQLTLIFKKLDTGKNSRPKKGFQTQKQKKIRGEKKNKTSLQRSFKISPWKERLANNSLNL